MASGWSLRCVMAEARPNGVFEELRLLAVLRALGEHGVRYVVFGAVALGLHGLARTTADRGAGGHAAAAMGD